MKIYLTVLVSLSLIRFVGKLADSKTSNQFVATLICVGMEILGIIFIWRI